MNAMTPQDLLKQELCEVLDMKKRFSELTQQMSQKVSNPDLKSTIQTHIEHGQKQMERFNQAFQQLGMQPQTSECLSAKGLVEKYQQNVQKIQAPEIIDSLTVSTMTRMGWFGFAFCEDLAKSARNAGSEQVANLFQENANQQKEDSEKIGQLAEKVHPTVSSKAG